MAQLPVRQGQGRGGSQLSRGREWDPFQRMQELMGWDPLEEFGRLLGGREGGLQFLPAFEVKETKDAFVFKADLPGVEEKDVEVTLTGDRLTVSGRREAEARTENERYFAYERSFGTFQRAFTLPEGVNADDVRADLKNGVLTLVLPKKPEMQPRRIQVSGSPGEKAKA